MLRGLTAVVVAWLLVGCGQTPAGHRLVVDPSFGIAFELPGGLRWYDDEQNGFVALAR